ncbi:hypothetical protein V2J09_002104 [Rumex salicifolius]
MYTDAEFLFPEFQEFSEEVQQLLHDELYYPSPMTESSFFSEYDLGVQGDLLRAPEPILEEQISIADQNVMPTQNQEAESLQQDELFTKVLQDCNENNSVVSSFETNQINEITRFPTEEMHSIQQSVSWESLMNPSFLDFSDYGMRRAFSEGDIKTLSYSYEDRQQKLTRYRTKKLKRNFGRRVKYACRKALADSQPRIRGRFASNTSTFSSRIGRETVEGINWKTGQTISERRQLHPLNSKKLAVLVLLSTYSHGDS